MKYTQTKIFEIICLPNLYLYKRSLFIYHIDVNVLNFVISLIATMQFYKGIGISAPQVGASYNIFIINFFSFNEIRKKCCCSLEKPYIFINSKITLFSSFKKKSVEGCISLNNLFLYTYRTVNQSVEYFNINSKVNLILMLRYIDSCCCQHEYDHINGIIFLDRLCNFKKNIVVKKLLN